MENHTNELHSAVETMESARPRKRRLLLFALLACIVAIVAGGTLAYFTAEKTAYNVITTGRLSMNLREETTGGRPFPEDGVTGILPGQTVDKKVYVVNDGSVDFYARIALDKVITDAAGRKDTLNFNHIRLDINTADWTEKDGYYYYNRALKPGEATEPLFNTVSFDTKLSNDYMNARVEIHVDAQAVQSRNNGGSALEATGWASAE